MRSVLEEIMASHRQKASEDRRSAGELEELLRSAPPARDFAGALRRAGRASGGIGVIAEIKRRSPSRGELAADLDPAALARAYEEGGASCLSVLTDEAYFGGSAGDLRAARETTALPVLRKDFTVAGSDLFDARAMGADAVLLIVAGLGDEELTSYLGLAGRLGLAALVEVHDEEECGRALRAGAELIGVNQRDLRTFEVDPERAVRVAERIPAEVLRVAESGVRDAADVARLGEAGFDAVLVGEALVTAAEPADALRRLRAEGHLPPPDAGLAARLGEPS